MPFININTTTVRFFAVKRKPRRMRKNLRGISERDARKWSFIPTQTYYITFLFSLFDLVLIPGQFLYS